MSLETQLRLSVIRTELTQLATSLDPHAARIVSYAVRVLGMLASVSSSAKRP